jgi:hypothetical protein
MLVVLTEIHVLSASPIKETNGTPTNATRLAYVTRILVDLAKQRLIIKKYINVEPPVPFSPLQFSTSYLND